MRWLTWPASARIVSSLTFGLVNQTDVRLGFDTARGVLNVVSANKSGQSTEEVALVVKGFARLKGEFGPLYLTRAFDDEGEPLSYGLKIGVELLFNDEQQEAFAQLPEDFSFKEAKHFYGRGDQATRNFLQKCIRVGILRQVGRGRYRKVVE